jgi:uncharacterized membrane-anchored protein
MTQPLPLRYDRSQTATDLSVTNRPGPRASRNQALSRFVLAALVSIVMGIAALAAPPDPGATPKILETPDQAYISMLRQAIGAPARADLADEATARLQGSLAVIPRQPATAFLTALGRGVPPDFVGLLLGSEGMDAPGSIRFVPAGFVDSDDALRWSPDDFLASLNDTVARANAARVKDGIEPREARRWIAPPRYNPELHQLSWAALVVPKSAPRETDGQIVYYGIGFGRDGYMEVSVVTSVQKADAIGRMVDEFLAGLNFVPAKAYGDVQPANPRSKTGLAGAMGIDSLHTAVVETNVWTSDQIVLIVGSGVAAIGALGLVIYIYRHKRRLRRRV